MSSIIEKITGTVKPLSKGSKLPTGSLKETNPQEANVNLGELADQSTIVVVGVPGAFTPPCSSQVPGYAEHADKFAEKGVKGIYIVAVNDAFTTAAWKEKLGVKHSIVHFLADDNGDWTQKAGLSFDASGLLGNNRSQRYAAIVKNGTVEEVFVEDDAPNVTVTAADKVLQHL